MKKKFKKHKNLTHSNPQPCVSQFTALPSSPSQSLTVDKQFYIKGKPCPETQLENVWSHMGTSDLWISSLPINHLSHANYVC